MLRAAVTSLVLLLVALIVVVGLAKVLSPVIEDGVAGLGLPHAFVGVVIALLVLAPETLAAANAARRNRLQGWQDDRVLWPVFVGCEPMTDVWFVGCHVSPRLTWCDSPDLPDDEVVHDVAMRVEQLPGPDGLPWGQLLRTDGLAVVRVGHDEANEITLSGYLNYDGYLQSSRQVPATVGVVRRIRVVQDLHDRGVDRWIRRPGTTRMLDVPDTSAEQLHDDPSFIDPQPDDWIPEPGSLVFVSEEQYLREYGHLLPAEQWQTRGLLVGLELA